MHLKEGCMCAPSYVFELTLCFVVVSASDSGDSAHLRVQGCGRLEGIENNKKMERGPRLIQASSSGVNLYRCTHVSHVHISGRT